ncbi:hypothetical protein [Arenimonas sp.]|uniref:hypothetical protein n=1 Tax=Arenimonas sp. TaxID=1872635 RepID=UPI002E38092E|nr:hypothetical protein [Arenimonas sp.]HEX4854518.1 hypothetical protein [Arenimonas sp.]
MNRAVLTLLIALSPLAVLAQSPAAPTPAPEAPVATPATGTDAGDEATPPAAPAADARAEDLADAEATHDRHCLRDTGTRIKRRDRRGCTPGIGESYTGEELRQTGATNTAEALRLLSPRVGG